jgi:tetratricopeptide (TPR) repeat protein
VVLAGILALAAGPGRMEAQMPMAMGMGHVGETKEQVPPEKLPPPRRMDGIGNARIEITGKPEAQPWFNQGLNLYHDFWDYEAARAFEQGIRVDPECAMCYWGLYQAESFYHSNSSAYAAPALAKAVSLKDRVSAREKLYIEATVAAASPSGSNALWRQLVKEYPDDREARIFLANSMGGAESVEVLRAVLKSDPENSAANHYLIHNLEYTDHPQDALPSAEILARLAPASGHMVHMPGHIFYLLGDYARAERAFADSMRVDELYMREQHVEPDDNWNYVHNLMYAVANLLEEGKLRDAATVSAKLSGARGEAGTTFYINSGRDSIARLNPQLPVALRLGDWAATRRLLPAETSFAGQPNLRFLAHALKDFATGMQAVERRDAPAGRNAAKHFAAALSRQKIETAGMAPAPAVPKNDGPPKNEVMPDARLQPLFGLLSVMSLELEASVLTTEGKVTDAKATFAKAADAEKKLGYREPPLYIRPVGETEGAAMLAAGEWAAAKAAYARALVERPHSGLGLFGLALSDEKAGENAEAAETYAAFLAAWNTADETLPQLEHARRFLSAHPVSAPAR